MDVLSVSQLTRSIKYQLNNQFPAVWVSGEISGITRPSSGHIYLTLKDAQAQINAIIWASDADSIGFEPTNGLKVVCRGGVDVYPPRGSYQLIIRKIQPQGIGALELAFRQLHTKLKSEGLFEDDHKRPIPRLPRHIAVVTSPTGAAIRDFLQVLTRRWPSIRVTIIPARVQGPGAAAEIATGIRICQLLQDPPDALVVTRGGGSIEDLWAFNEEAVVRAIHACNIPVVSGVGHEIDVTLSDLVADVRALTPSEAAERLVPEISEVQQYLKSSAQRLRQAMLLKIDRAQEDIAMLASRPILTRPTEAIRLLGMELDHLEKRLTRASGDRIEKSRLEISAIASRLESISPLSVLARGYSLSTDSEGNLLHSIDDIAVGQQVETRLADGSFRSTIQIINLAD